MAAPTPNEQHVTMHAEEHGWHVHDRDDLQTAVEFRKRGGRYLRVAFGLNGHILSAVGPDRPLRRSTSAVLDYLTTH